MSESSERAGKRIEIEAEAGPYAGYLAKPASGSGPGVLVIQEWWGLVPHIEAVCDRLAREGFVALAPDLYRGEQTTDPDVAGRLMMDLQIDRAAADLDAAVARLRAEPGVLGTDLGCVGFCMGGQLALSAGCRNPALAAIVDCYGVHPNVSPDLDALTGAVFGVFAEHDEFVPDERVRALDAALSAAGKRAELKVYPGVQHAFLNDTRPDVYDAATAADAWRDILSFLRAELAG